MVSSKYLNSETQSISLPSNNITGRIVVGREVNIINLLFEALGTSLFKVRYAVRSAKIFLILVIKPPNVSEVKTKAASWANSTVISSTAIVKSLINKLKHNGSRIDPWGNAIFT